MRKRSRIRAVKRRMGISLIIGIMDANNVLLRKLIHVKAFEGGGRGV